MWGFSSSPLVTEGIVAVYAGGEGDKGLLAYRAATGEPAWTTATGPVSYSSPQLASIDGQPQMLLLSDRGLVSVEPESGTVLWQFEAPASGIWRVVQPRQVDGNGILIGSEDLGLTRLEITRDLKSWTAVQRWKSKAIRGRPTTISCSPTASSMDLTRASSAVSTRKRANASGRPAATVTARSCYWQISECCWWSPKAVK